MSMLLDLQDEILRTNEAVARAERTVAEHPTLLSAQATLRGFLQLLDRLQEEFVAAAEAVGRDVCSYAIETDDPSPPMQNIMGVWDTFQRLFTTVYDVIVSGKPKQIEYFSDTVANATRFGFAYTFSGSVGLVMTVEKGGDLVPDTALDSAIKSVFDIMKARRPEEIMEVNQRFGIAAVKIAREWADENARSRFGAKVEWHGAGIAPQRFRIQTPEIIELERAIDRAAQLQTEVLFGELVDVNYEERSFQMRVAADPHPPLISGTYTDAISPENPARVPSRYRAEMRVSRRLVPQEPAEAVSYFLVSLSPDG